MRKWKVVTKSGIRLEVLTKTMKAFILNNLPWITFELNTSKPLRTPTFSVMEWKSFKQHKLARQSLWEMKTYKKKLFGVKDGLFFINFPNYLKKN
jgi:hypothetical protein